MNVLHLASFNGNIGDNAHHNGFRAAFEDEFGVVNWTDMEIRLFYKSWSLAKFDDSFAHIVNKYDALIIGGGNFFEVCHDYSSTGCTIDIEEDILKKIDIPIFFNALGFDTKKGTSSSNLIKFRKFILSLANRKNTLISFRNDGSIENYIDAYGHLDDFIFKIPDGGFFIQTERKKTIQNLIGINLACDMLDKRLINKSYTEFLYDLKSVYYKLIDGENCKLRFFPHIFTDIKIIYDLLSTFEDKKIKYNVEVMPYLTGQGSEKQIFSLYSECELVTGMRFHANVCAFGMGIKTTPISTYPKLADTYLDIKSKELVVDANRDTFASDYYAKIIQCLKNEYDNSIFINDLKIKQQQIIKKFKSALIV